MGSLIDYLPERHKSSPETAEVQQSLQRWADKMHADKSDLFDQFFIRSATWGLDIWEAALGVGADISKPYRFRRARIESKLRGLGATTKATIETVAASFSNGEVEVVEHNDEYRFDVVFTGTIGIPPNMGDLTAAIEEVKPAHLAFGYVYVYRTWGMVSHLTWGNAGTSTWHQLKEGAI
jgi:uncharacterized protein YmfQ (DUF2313 family)